MIFYWIFFITYCLFHLVTCYLEREFLRKITKVFIIPLLILGLVLTKTFNLWLYIGLTLGWIGDILLLFTGKKRYFVIGGISFLLGHLAYVCSSMALLLDKYSFSEIPFWAYAILAVVAITFLILTTVRIRKHFGVFAYHFSPLCLYYKVFFWENQCLIRSPVFGIRGFVYVLL